MPRAYSYLRFSSKKQEKGESRRRQWDFAVEVSQENGWVLDDTLTLTDLGVSAFRGKSLLSHRVAWEFAFGPAPKGVWVRQRCGNRLCCNPAHLFLAMNGTATPEESETAVRAWVARSSGSACGPTSAPVGSPCS